MPFIVKYVPRELEQPAIALDDFFRIPHISIYMASSQMEYCCVVRREDLSLAVQELPFGSSSESGRPVTKLWPPHDFRILP